MKLSKYYTHEIVFVPKWLGFIIQVTRMWYRWVRAFITPHPFAGIVEIGYYIMVIISPAQKKNIIKIGPSRV